MREQDTLCDVAVNLAADRRVIRQACSCRRVFARCAHYDAAEALEGFKVLACYAKTAVKTIDEKAFLLECIKVSKRKSVFQDGELKSDIENAAIIDAGEAIENQLEFAGIFVGRVNSLVTAANTVVTRAA